MMCRKPISGRYKFFLFLFLFLLGSWEVAIYSGGCFRSVDDGVRSWGRRRRCEDLPTIATSFATT